MTIHKCDICGKLLEEGKKNLMRAREIEKTE